jgi:phosphopantothenoylcysteine decarboxylase/phosphopantothenate--cysteine ligase
MGQASLKGRRILLGVTGGIAAYKSAELCRLLMKAGAAVRVIMTHSATEFVPPLTFETLSGYPVYNDVFDRRHAWEVEHIAHARWADTLLVAPATANSLSKMALGLADDALSTTALAFNGTVIVAPAMNTAMWRHTAIVEHLALLRQRGTTVIEPTSGDLACGEKGAGRLADLDTIVEAVATAKPTGPLAGKTVLITAGPTVEPIDPVRFLSNGSSGRMGYALAREAARRGAAVVLVSGPVALEPPAMLQEVVNVRTASQMHDAVMERLDDADYAVFSAAVADYTPIAPSKEKIKKRNGNNGMTLEMRRTPDIAAAAGKRRREGQILIGFAAETQDAEKQAVKKMRAKHCDDILVINTITPDNPAFGSTQNAVLLLSRNGARRELALQNKEVLAEPIWDFILEHTEQETG